MNKNRIDRLIKEAILKINDCESLPTCESCLLGKMIKSLFRKKGERASDILDLVYSDVCRPMNLSIRGRYSYFITDDLSGHGCVWPNHLKCSNDSNDEKDDISKRELDSLSVDSFSEHSESERRS